MVFVQFIMNITFQDLIHGGMKNSLKDAEKEQAYLGGRKTLKSLFLAPELE